MQRFVNNGTLLIETGQGFRPEYSLPMIREPGSVVPKVLPPDSEDVVRVMRNLADTETNRTWLKVPSKPEPGKFPLTREAIDNAITAEGDCIIVQIIGGQIYVLAPNEHRYLMYSHNEERRMETLRYLQFLLDSQVNSESEVPPASTMNLFTQQSFPWSRGLRDVLRKRMSLEQDFWLLDNEFALCVRDYPTTQNPFEPVQLIEGEPLRSAGNSPSSAFGHMACAHRAGNVGLPIWNIRRLKGFKNWANIIDSYTSLARTSPSWHERKSQAIFRGEYRYCYATRDDFTVPYTYDPKEDRRQPSNNSLKWTGPYHASATKLPAELKPHSQLNVAPGAQPVRHGGPTTYVVTKEANWKLCGRNRLGYLSTLSDTSGTSDSATFLHRYLTLKSPELANMLLPPPPRVSPLNALLDVALGDMPPYMRKAGIAQLEKNNFIPMKNWNQYKLMITAEGNCGWGDRIKNQVFLNVGLVLQESMCKEWYTPLLQPWVHYIPTDYHWNSLHTVLLWAHSDENQHSVQQMIKNMNTWAHAILSPESIELYTREALNTHARRLAFPLVLRPGAESLEKYAKRMSSASWLTRRAHHEVSAFMEGRPIFWTLVSPTLLLMFIAAAKVLYQKLISDSSSLDDSTYMKYAKTSVGNTPRLSRSATFRRVGTLDPDSRAIELDELDNGETETDSLAEDHAIRKWCPRGHGLESDPVESHDTYERYPPVTSEDESSETGLASSSLVVSSNRPRAMAQSLPQTKSHLLDELWKHKWIAIATILILVLFDAHWYTGLMLREMIGRFAPLSPERATGLDQVVGMLPCVINVLEQHQVTWFLDEGSLLGAVRNKGAIPGDGDADIAILARDKDKVPLLVRDWEKVCNFYVVHRDDARGLARAITLYTTRRLLMRIFPSYWGPNWYIDVREYDIDENGILYDKDFLNVDDTYVVPVEDVLPTVPCMFSGVAGQCPRNSTYIVEELYGPDWKTPKPGFKTTHMARPTPVQLYQRAMERAKTIHGREALNPVPDCVMQASER